MLPLTTLLYAVYCCSLLVVSPYTVRQLVFMLLTEAGYYIIVHFQLLYSSSHVIVHYTLTDLYAMHQRTLVFSGVLVMLLYGSYVTVRCTLAVTSLIAVCWQLL